jgi:hypothetical protein
VAPSHLTDRVFVNGYFFVAASILIVTGIVHSSQGERLIFRRMRKAGLIPTDGGTVLRESFVRILWASWHILSVLGFAMAWMLATMGLTHTRDVLATTVAQSIALALFVSAALVFFGTKGRHLGWAALLASAIATTLGIMA